MEFLDPGNDTITVYLGLPNLYIQGLRLRVL